MSDARRGYTPTPPPSVPPPGAPGADAATPTAASSGSGAPGPEGPRQPGAPSEHVDRPGLDDRDRTLDPRVVQVWRVMTTLILLIPLTALSLAGVISFGVVGIAAPVLALVILAVLVGWYPRKRWQRWRWRLTPLALELRYGVVIRTQESVPYFRIQQIDIAQGPVDRLLELATLQVTTASASGSVSLPGIPAEQAPEVRAELLARAAEAVADHPGEVRDAV